MKINVLVYGIYSNRLVYPLVFGRFQFHHKSLQLFIFKQDPRYFCAWLDKKLHSEYIDSPCVKLWQFHLKMKRVMEMLKLVYFNQDSGTKLLATIVFAAYANEQIYWE